MKSHWAIEVAKVLVYVAFGIAIAMLMGCRTLPRYMDECEISEEWIGEVQECKDKVLAREDRRVEKAHQEQLDKALAEKCWREQRGLWDKNSGRCRDWNML